MMIKPLLFSAVVLASWTAQVKAEFVWECLDYPFFNPENNCEYHVNEYCGTDFGGIPGYRIWGCAKTCGLCAEAKAIFDSASFAQIGSDDCKDYYAGDCERDLIGGGGAGCSVVYIAQVCQKSCGACKGPTDEEIQQYEKAASDFMEEIQHFVTTGSDPPAVPIPDSVTSALENYVAPVPPADVEQKPFAGEMAKTFNAFAASKGLNTQAPVVATVDHDVVVFEDDFVEAGDDPNSGLQGSASGDPHFKSWTGRKFDFHGGCDLVLVHSPRFGQGLGLHIHIRTKIETWWSYIETAAVRIGANVLEVAGGVNGGQYWINGESLNALEDKDTFDFSGLTGIFRRISEKQLRFRIDLGNGDALSIETYKDWVSVNVKANTVKKFEGSVGLMGSFPEGKMLARDGKTLVEDADSFGNEWQVLASEPMLFHDIDGPQHPQTCNMPDKTAAKIQRRRLGQGLITEEDAAIACAHVGEDDQDACIFDVLATNDKDMAGSY